MDIFKELHKPFSLSVANKIFFDSSIVNFKDFFTLAKLTAPLLAKLPATIAVLAWVTNKVPQHPRFFKIRNTKEPRQTKYYPLAMDKYKLTGQNLGRVFNSRLSHVGIGRAIVHNKTA